MPNSTVELANQSYVPVIRNSKISYGGSQMWFPKSIRNSKEHIIHTYGCGTIATADMFLYLALQKKELNTTLTSIALPETMQILYDNYLSYVLEVHNKYTKTKRYLAVLGPSLAHAINNYSNQFTLGYVATWKWRLSYYEMLDQMEFMLSQDIPVILSIGPNTPKLWGRHGISFYEHKEIEYQASEEVINTSSEVIDLSTNDDEKLIIDVKDKEETKSPQNNEGNIVNKDVTDSTELKDDKDLKEYKEPIEAKNNLNIIENKLNGTAEPIVRRKPYYYKASYNDIHGHYVTVTGIVKDDVAGRIMLRISSWGREYYINYEEYRDYIESHSGTYTSSMVHIKKDRIYYYHK
ncbi:MAG: hypothetical protein QM644_11865 [Mobilitalea sp.]